MSHLIFTKLITITTSSLTADCDCDCDCASNIPPHSTATPTAAYLELTPACNNRCVGCSNVFISDKPTRKMETATAPLDIAAWRIILGKLAPTVERVSITGGEPTLYKHFDEFVALLDEYSLRFTLFTNARWHNAVTTVAALRQTPHLNGLLISLHGAEAAAHEAFTLIDGSYHETLENIKRATAAGLPVTLSTIITRYCYDQSQAIYELAQTLGVQRVAFNRYVGLSTDDSASSPQQLKQALIDIERLRLQGANVKLTVTVPQCFHPTSATGCGAGETFVTVDPWGNVKPCNHTPMILGNLLYDSPAQVMASPQLDYWRNLHPAGCNDCAAQSICGGGCRAEAMLHQSPGDTLIQGPYLADEASYTKFFVLPDYLHPIATHPFTADDLVAEIPHSIRQALSTSLHGSLTLKELGHRHGQEMLDLVGTMHQEGVVEFV